MFSAASIVLPLLLAFLPAGQQQQPAPTPAPATASSAASQSAEVDHEDGFTVVGLTVRTTNEAEATGHGKIPQLWEAVLNNSSLEVIPNRSGGEMYVVYSDYDMNGSGEYSYTLGVRVSSVGKLPDSYVVRNIESGKYAVVTSEQGPPQQVIPGVWQKIAQMTPEQLGGTRAYQTDFEVYPANPDFNSIQITAHVGLK